MSNVEILSEYEEKRQQLWNDKHELEIRKMLVFDSILKTEYEAFICPIGNYEGTVYLYNEDGFQTVSYNKFNLYRYTFINSEELLSII